MTALLGEPALFNPGMAQFPSRAKRFWSCYIGIPPYSDRLIGENLLQVDTRQDVG